MEVLYFDGSHAWIICDNCNQMEIFNWDRYNYPTIFPEKVIKHCVIKPQQTFFSNIHVNIEHPSISYNEKLVCVHTCAFVRRLANTIRLPRQRSYSLDFQAEVPLKRYGELVYPGPLVDHHYAFPSTFKVFGLNL